MKALDPRFLKDPAEIRKAVRELQGGKRLDLAVAFVGADWWELLGDHRDNLRVICWLSSTNTNPNAVEDMIKRPNTEVRQRDSMHCKVYISPSVGAVVGSANLSKAALSEDDIAGQDEAAVSLTDPTMLNQIEGWFENLWDDHRTRPIHEAHLRAAKASWEKAKTQRATRSNGNRNRNRALEVPPVPSKFHPTILEYAEAVRSMGDLESDLGQPCRFVKSIEPGSLTANQQRQLVKQIVTWTRHPGSYRTFLGQPIADVRKGLSLLFDDSQDPLDRLELIWQHGYLKGLQMPTIGLLLYWRNPERFPPYNFRTAAFLRDFDLIQKGLSASSPLCYERWRRYATRLAQQLRLPTPGHVDRMVERYYEDYHVSS